jgi:general transcription factor 3C polypeptide 2
MQSASLCLTTTPAEEMALGLARWLGPLRLIRLPVDEIALTLLLSLRFMALVFEEIRNLAMGLAARAVPWRRLPPGGGIQVRRAAPSLHPC